MRLLLFAIVMLLIVVACGREPAPVAPAPSLAPATTSPPAPAPVDAPTATMARSHADATSTAPEAPVLRAVRAGMHAQFDRVVFEFDGAGLPAWDIEYVTPPVTDCGAGQPVAVQGGAVLQVRFHGANAHTPEGQPTSGPGRRAYPLPTVLELVRTCDFEAEVTWLVGVSAAKPYTPSVMESPSRLVVDIAH